MYMSDLFYSTKDKIIGTAVINKHGGIVLADEAVYSFLGKDSVPNFFSYIREDVLDEFNSFFFNCTEQPKSFATYLKRYDDEYTLVSVIIKRVESQGKEYIELKIYDALYLAERYDTITEYSYKFSGYMKISGKYFIEYEVATNLVMVYKENEFVFDGDIESFISMIVDGEYISEDTIDDFQHACNSLKNCTSSFCYRLKTKKSWDIVPAGSMLAVNGTNIEINGKNKYIVCTVNVVTGDNNFVDNIKEKVNLDALTGLLNKTAIKSYVINKIVSEKTRRITIAIVDLDNFKMVNDTYGHMFGDDTLVTVATVLRSIVGNRGAVGRIGGDEFLIALENFEDGDASIRPIIKAIRNHVEWSFKNVLSDIKVTCSIGIASYPDNADTYDNLFKIADRCLYIAKSKGRDRYIIYTPSIHGNLSDIVNVSNTINMGGNSVSESHKNTHLLTVIDRLNNVDNYVDGKNIVRKIMLEMLYYYSIDRIGFYPFSPHNATVQVCNYDIKNADVPAKLYDSYAIEFSNDIATIGNYANIEAEFPELYEHMKDNNINSMLANKIYDKNDETKLKGLFIVSTYNRYQKWSAIDIKLITILFKLLSKYI